MKLMVRPLDREAEKRLLRVLAEVALEVGREDAMGAGGRCEADEMREEGPHDETGAHAEVRVGGSHDETGALDSVRVGSSHDEKGAHDEVRVGSSHDEKGALDSVRVSGALDRVTHEDARGLCT